MSRFVRQQDLVPDGIQSKTIGVIGTGAVGRQVAKSLAAMGAKNVTLVDFDIVEEVNLNTQGWSKKDLGKPKVECLIEDMKESDYENDANFVAKNEPYDPDECDFDIVFACVDSMEVRNSIFKQVERSKTDLLIDGRMAGGTLRFLAVGRDSLPLYEKSLFKDEDAVQGRCTQQSTIYTASILANLMIGEMCLHLRGFKRQTDKVLDLLDYQL